MAHVSACQREVLRMEQVKRQGAACTFGVALALRLIPSPASSSPHPSALLYNPGARHAALIASFSWVRSDECPLIGFQFYSLSPWYRITELEGFSGGN